MASRLVSDTLVTLRPHNRRSPLPSLSPVSRSLARLALLALTLIGLFMFIYLMEVSGNNTTAFDIEGQQMEYQAWVERNQLLERQIAELESPTHVLEYAEEHGMTPRTDAQYIWVEQVPE